MALTPSGGCNEAGHLQPKVVEEAPTPEPAKKKRPVWGIILVIAVAIMALLLFHFTRGHGPKPAEPVVKKKSVTQAMRVKKLEKK